FGSVGIKHCRADARCEILFFGKRVEVLEESDSLLRRQALGVFGERLRGDADGFDLIAAGFQNGFRTPQHLKGVGELLLVLRAVEIEKGGDGADFGFSGSWGGRFLLGEKRHRQEQKRNHCEEANAHGTSPSSTIARDVQQNKIHCNLAYSALAC